MDDIIDLPNNKYVSCVALLFYARLCNCQADFQRLA